MRYNRSKSFSIIDIGIVRDKKSLLIIAMVNRFIVTLTDNVINLLYGRYERLIIVISVSITGASE